MKSNLLITGIIRNYNIIMPQLLLTDFILKKKFDSCDDVAVLLFSSSCNNYILQYLLTFPRVGN